MFPARLSPTFSEFPKEECRECEEFCFRIVEDVSGGVMFCGTDVLLAVTNEHSLLVVSFGVSFLGLFCVAHHGNGREPRRRSVLSSQSGIPR